MTLPSPSDSLTARAEAALDWAMTTPRRLQRRPLSRQ